METASLQQTATWLKDQWHLGWSLKRIERELEANGTKLPMRLILDLLETQGISRMHAVRLEPLRQFADHVPENLEMLVEVSDQLRELQHLVDSGQPPPKLDVAIQAAREWKNLLLIQLAFAGVVPERSRVVRTPIAPHPEVLPSSPPPSSGPVRTQAPAPTPAPEAVSQVPSPAASATPITIPPVARNALCPCGAGKKFKKCCAPGAPRAQNASQSAAPG